SGSVPATDVTKSAIAREAGIQVMSLVARGQRPRDLLTRTAFENAIRSVAATGGSTNAVLHLMAIAREAGVTLTLDDFDSISARTPLIADLKPAGRFVAVDLHAAGGHRLVARRLVEADLVDGLAPTVTGKSLAEEASTAVEAAGQRVVSGVSNPL